MKNKKPRRRRGKSMKKLWIIPACIVAVLVLVYVGGSVFFANHFLLNTKINGHDFSGKSAADVETFFKGQVKGYKLTVLEKDNKSDTIEGSDISLAYKENDSIKKALGKQNGFLWPVSFFAEKSSKVTVEVSYDQSALDGKIQSLQAVNAEQIPAKSAAPKFDGEKYVIEPEVIGTAVDMDALNKKVHQYISEFKSELNMEKEKCYSMPKYTSKSEEVKKACDTMNNYVKASITYTMTQPEVVDKALISTWLSVDDNMNVTFHEDAVKAWLTAFGDKYDTVATTRTITTPTGKVAEVSGGTYGWSIDEDKEFEALINSIKAGETVSKEPAYYQTAAVHGPQDWGNTYAEVDLSAQHMWYIVDGAVALETDVVTGEPIPEKITPEGVFDILETQRDKILVGDIKPETGKPEYETHVTFWMRITWTGIGFHDAIWQSAFGGSLNQIPDVGSHGCVNMPYDKAEALFNMLAVGTPVIVHY
ncbi:MAG: peptidoglycan binding domain-containing protein [Muricomes sp.]